MTAQYSEDIENRLMKYDTFDIGEHFPVEDWDKLGFQGASLICLCLEPYHGLNKDYLNGLCIDNFCCKPVIDKFIENDNFALLNYPMKLELKEDNEVSRHGDLLTGLYWDGLEPINIRLYSPDEFSEQFYLEPKDKILFPIERSYVLNNCYKLYIDAESTEDLYTYYVSLPNSIRKDVHTSDLTFVKPHYEPVEDFMEIEI